MNAAPLLEYWRRQDLKIARPQPPEVTRQARLWLIPRLLFSNRLEFPPGSLFKPQGKSHGLVNKNQAC